MVSSVLRAVIPAFRTGALVAIAGAVAQNTVRKTNVAARAKVAGATSWVEGVTRPPERGAKVVHGAIGPWSVLELPPRLLVRTKRPNAINPATDLARFGTTVQVASQARVEPVVATTVTLGLVGSTPN